MKLAGVPVRFPAEGAVRVVASPGSRLSPPGWVGVVVLADTGIATVPTDTMVGMVRDRLAGSPADAWLDVDRWRTWLPVVDSLGPATLAYLDEREFRRADDPPGLTGLHPGHTDLHALRGSMTAEEAEESGIAEITSNAFVIRARHDVVAAAGYRIWPGSVAHLSVLTAPGHRGRGLARAVASAAAADALAHRLLPQWRARPGPSCRVASALGFRRLGGQLSIRIDS